MINEPVLPIESLADLRIDGLTFQALRWNAVTTMPFHEHPQCHYVLVLAGSVKDTRKHESNERGLRCLSYLPAGEIHATASSAGSEIFQFVFSEELRLQYQDCLDEPSEFKNDLPSFLAAQMAEELMHGDDLSPMMLKGLGIQLLTLTARAKRTQPPAHPLWLTRAKDYLQAHFTESITIEELAAVASVHPAHLMRCFRREFSCTIGDYVRKLRIDYACQLLAAADRPLSAIASEAGFADQSHFIRAIKVSTGMTPTAYQRAHGKA